MLSLLSRNSPVAGKIIVGVFSVREGGVVGGVVIVAPGVYVGSDGVIVSVGVSVASPGVDVGGAGYGSSLGMDVLVFVGVFVATCASVGVFVDVDVDVLVGVLVSTTPA